MDVLVRAARNFCESSAEMSCHSPVPPASPLGTAAEQIGPAWYHKNHRKTPIDFSRVMVCSQFLGFWRDKRCLKLCTWTQLKLYCYEVVQV